MKILTSEAVFKGHPDKICDQISDAVLDACLEQDPKSRVACECLIKDDVVILAGEITTEAEVDFIKVVNDVLSDIGVEGHFKVLEKISKQSPDIALGVNKEGAGDQGIMYGYATNETKELMPLPIVLARKIAIKMDELTKPIRQIFGADGKCQVSVAYDEKGKPIKVTTVVVSQQTSKGLDRNFYTNFIINECVKKVIPAELFKEDTVVLVNPTGEFSKGGSFADCGLTGRKIICDTYGGLGRHGGGAFSGKDVTKVDRLGAYYARYVAKNIVASGLADKCEVQVGYAIGIKKPVSVNIECFGTNHVPQKVLESVVDEVFNFETSSMRKEIIREGICFKDLASYGHIGRSDILVPWEKTNKYHQISKVLRNINKNG